MSYFEVTVPTQNGYIFSNARSNDVVIHTQNSNQRYLMGTTSNGVAEFQIDKGLITLNGNVTGCNVSFNATSFTCSGVTNLVGDTTLTGNLIFNNAIGMSRLRINQYTSNAPINLISTVVGLSNETNGMNLNTACNYIRFLGSNNMEMARFSNSNLYVASNISCSNLLTASNINFTGQLQQNGVQFSGSPFSTSNLNSSSFTAQASSCTGTNYPYFAIDQNSSTQWESVGESGNNFSTYPTTINTVGAYGGEWLQINMPTPITVTTMTLLNSAGNNSSFWPTSWRLAGYSNAVWYPIGGVQSGASPFTFNSGTAYSSFRICIAQSANTMVWISEVVFNSPIQLQQYILPGCMTLTGNLLANAGVTNSLYYYSSIQFTGNSYWNVLTQILGMPASITYITANSLNWIVPVSGIWSLTANLILYAGGASWTTFNVGITKNANPTSQSQTGISINNDLSETIGSGCNWLADLNTYNTQGQSPTILTTWQAYGYNLACTTILFAGETIQIHCSVSGLSVSGSMRNALIQQINA